jgi:hypothetical protein
MNVYSVNNYNQVLGEIPGPLIYLAHFHLLMGINSVVALFFQRKVFVAMEIAPTRHC